MHERRAGSACGMVHATQRRALHARHAGAGVANCPLTLS